MLGWKGTLYNTHIAHLLPLKTAYKIRYHHLNKRWPDLDDPKRFTEKLMWLTRYNELYNREFIQRIYDKHLVRDYVRECGLENILTNELFNCKDAKDMVLPKDGVEYIIKSTQSSGQNIIVSKETNRSEDEIRDIVKGWGESQKDRDRFQGYYFTENESIMCEELLRNERGVIPNDYRLCCCNGKVQWIYIDIDTTDENMKHRKVYYREYFDKDWNYLPIDNIGRIRKNKTKAETEKPANLEEMIKIAESLAANLLFARVDLYNINGKIYFGEITPIPGMAGGFQPDEWDFIFGDKVVLPEVDIW